MRPAEPRSGDVLTAKWLSDLLRYTGRAIFGVTYPLLLDESTGGRATLSVDTSALGGGGGTPARITGHSSGGGYDWTALKPLPMGAWADLPSTGSGAYEFGGNTHVAAGTRVDLLRQADGSLRFQMAACP